MRRVVITGMSVNTVLGDSVNQLCQNLLLGRSGITKWKGIDSTSIYSKVGGDLSDYRVDLKIQSWEARLPAPILSKLRKLALRTTWSTQLTLLLAVEAWFNAGLFEEKNNSDRIGSIVAGHNLNINYEHKNYALFSEDPNFIDPFYSLNGLDSGQAAIVAELIQAFGGAYIVGGACASGNLALRAALDEIRFHGLDTVLVTGAVYDFSPADLHGMCLMGATSFRNFNESPEKASRPFDLQREGFVPSHGGGALVLEELDVALARGAKIYGEILGVEASSDGNHLPQPSELGQTRMLKKLFAQTGVSPEQIDFVSAHATSTQAGDLTEIASIKNVFKDHAFRLKINAPKSMLGHSCWSSAIVETIAAISQMHLGKLHPSINIDQLDPAVDLDICRNGPVTHEVNYFLKNSFGFGGINSGSIIRKNIRD